MLTGVAGVVVVDDVLRDAARILRGCRGGLVGAKGDIGVPPVAVRFEGARVAPYRKVPAGPSVRW